MDRNNICTPGVHAPGVQINRDYQKMNIKRLAQYRYYPISADLTDPTVNTSGAE